MPGVAEAITGVLRLKVGREKAPINRHPWVFSGAVERVEGAPQPGDLVAVNDHRGHYLATGYFNPHSQIRARLLTWDPDQPIDQAFWHGRLRRALDGRMSLALASDTDAYRLANAESDGLPGLVVDVYEEYLVLQAQTLGIDKRKEQLTAILVELLGPTGVLERSDVPSRRKEGLTLRSGLLWGSEPPNPLVIMEAGRRFYVDLWKGHKTGFYLDQRENRALFGNMRWIVGKSVLNVFAYTGGFSVYAASAGAGEVTHIDSSVTALEMAEANMKLNFPERADDVYLAGDAFDVLRHLRGEADVFDAVILDPPKFAQSQGDVPRAARGYKDLNLQALGLIRPGGLLATFSCSGHVSRELFQKVLFAATVDAGREVQILAPLSQAPDHPELVTFPESAYLKGFLCRVW